MALTCTLTKHDSRRYSYINHIFSFSENEKVKDKVFWTPDWHYQRIDRGILITAV